MRALASRNRRSGQTHSGAFTLVELLIIIALIGTIAMIIVPGFINYIDRAARNRVIRDLLDLQVEIESFERFQERFPESLDELSDGVPRYDRWGNPYQYLSSDDNDWNGKARKDRFLVPLNSDYDLYSMGPDGVSASPLTAEASWDDIVRANDGLYMGPANEF
jgi:general secretion pathway protein G